MDRPQTRQLTPSATLTDSPYALRHDLSTVVRAALDAVDAGRLVQRALADPLIVSPLQMSSAVDVIAAGKAAAPMLNAGVAALNVPLRTTLVVGPVRPAVLPDGAEWFGGGHPFPTPGSLAAAARAREVAGRSGPDDVLLVLLSGGGSALMALPAEGITLEEKQQTARLLMEAGADIYELNTVRKHLSAIKGGQLAAGAAGRVITLAISDVVGDDLSVIASGPTVPDDSTFAAAMAVIDRRGGRARYPESVVARLERGARGEVAETPQTGDPRLARTTARVIGSQRGALHGAREAAASLGYHVHEIESPIVGEARERGRAHADVLGRVLESMPRPLCVISSGETTVTVTGRGRGGRNQEFALGLADALAARPPFHGEVAAASVGTDGIDGPTDAAGAIVDGSTIARAHAAGLEPYAYLDDNNTYEFFDRLGDLIRTGPTNTNVGDLQVVLIR
jgi:glycerate 2-kinase